MYTDSNELFVEEEDGVNNSSNNDDNNNNVDGEGNATVAEDENPMRQPQYQLSPVDVSSRQQAAPTSSSKSSSGNAGTTTVAARTTTTIASSSSPQPQRPSVRLTSPTKQRKVHEALLLQGHTIESLRDIVSPKNLYDTPSITTTTTTTTSPSEATPAVVTTAFATAANESLPPTTESMDHTSNSALASAMESTIDVATTAATTTTTGSTADNDALLGPYERTGTQAVTTGITGTTTTTKSTYDPPPAQQLPQHNRRSILRSTSGRRSNRPPHQKQLSFVKRQSGDGTSTTASTSTTTGTPTRLLLLSSSTRANSFRNKSQTSASSLDRSDGSMRSTGGSVTTGSTNGIKPFHLFSSKGSFFHGRNSASSSGATGTEIKRSQSQQLQTSFSTVGNFATQQRRYKVGDNVLVKLLYDTTDTISISIHNQFVCTVNKYGFVMNDPRCQMDDEYCGPYQYVIASVQQIHYEETHPYYTVQRYDMMNLTTTTTTNTNSIHNKLRADFYQVEPVMTQRHEMAALQAATNTRTALQRALLDGTIIVTENGQLYYDDITQENHYHFGHDGLDNNKSLYHSSTAGSHIQPTLRWYHYLLLTLQIPFFCIVDGSRYVWYQLLIPSKDACVRYLRTQANLFLYGHEPYLCRIRLTMLNFVVLCSTWFMFIDQVRLAFFPHTADDVIAMIDFGVWIVLICELFCEVFIRPEGYQGLLMSDKAFAPTTVRFINTIHVVIELIALFVFIPEFFCLFTNYSCSDRLPFSFYNAVLIGVIGPTHTNVFLGHAYIALVRLRIFCMVRHWKNMWVTRTFINMTWRSPKNRILSNIIPPAVSRGSGVVVSQNNLRKMTDTTSTKSSSSTDRNNYSDKKLTNASNIGTALMVINSYRTLAIVCVVAGLFPIIFSSISTLINPLSYRMTDQLQASNVVAADTSNATCSFLRDTVTSWLIATNTRGDRFDAYLLTLDLQPRRCGYSSNNFMNVDVCRGVVVIPEPAEDVCMKWYNYADLELTIAEIADAANIRRGSITEFGLADVRDLTVLEVDGSEVVSANTTFSTVTRFDHSLTIEIAARTSVLLQMFLLFAVLGGLSILRRDVEILVLGPLRRMLKIVDRYARNPLIQTKISHHRSSGHRRLHNTHKSDDDDTVSYSGSDDDDDHSTDEELGSFETEQLITAVAKITDLLRKCWGVAGADIISTNLSTQEGTLTEVFNPTVPGKSVYALFGFISIGGFDNALRNLGGEVMPLINDVAHVVHGEVFRWGFGDSGQCNKNLGSAFLMVFRIGLVKEVIDKLEQATDVVFSTSAGKKSQVSIAIKRRQFQRNSVLRSSSASSFSSPRARNLTGSAVPQRSSLTTQRKSAEISDAMKLSLHSLPGISTFTDRAVIGMLKSYAGIYRDRNVLKWNYRLGAGVGAFKIGMIFGMDAGWAVEGAVGSEYKIDATYLSPHVNMASRMMSACKQYDVTIMLSQAVQELMSDVAQTKLRHLDTVTVKGSSVKQKIFTYDARAKGVDFFLHSRSDSQADAEAERYSPSLWNSDPDLVAMRQHVTEKFLKAFKDGHKAFLLGDWPLAIEKLEQANNVMLQSAIEDGYLEDEFDSSNLHPGGEIPEQLKQDNGDGPSMYLLSFMRSYNGVAPIDWHGWHPLIRK